jgi:N-acetylglucosaminyldiphosphoundecaprenol N-acetyl-beta-D-mannosaminyltransferase
VSVLTTAVPEFNNKSINERFINRVTSLGVPVDNLSKQETVAKVMGFIDQYATDKTPRLVATLNVDFLVNSLGFSPRKPRHPELLSILRNADIITADGFPIVLLSKISGYPLKERVTGADLVTALAAKAAQTGKSIYLLGGAQGSANKAATKLTTDYPGLVIAGTSAPMIATEGENMADWCHADEKIVNEINNSKADILLLALGNPKQELWFNRNKHRLSVPVSIGVGGTFEFLIGVVSRAPLWMQNNGMEWLYRIAQDPKRLLKRYTIGLIKLSVLSRPLLQARIQRHCQSKIDRVLRRSNNIDTTPEWRLHWSSKDDCLVTLRLPMTVSREYMENLVLSFDLQVITETSYRTCLLDFSQVKKIDMAANEAFAVLARKLSALKSTALIVGMSKRICRDLSHARVMDLASPKTLNSTSDAIDSYSDQHSQSNRICKSYVVENSVLLCLTGVIEGVKLANLGVEECMLDAGRDREIIVDLRQVEQIDSTAISLLFKLVLAEKNGLIKRIQFSGTSEVIKQMLCVSGLNNQFNELNDEDFYSVLFCQ